MLFQFNQKQSRNKHRTIEDHAPAPNVTKKTKLKIEKAEKVYRHSHEDVRGLNKQGSAGKTLKNIQSSLTKETITAFNKAPISKNATGKS